MPGTDFYHGLIMDMDAFWVPILQEHNAFQLNPGLVPDDKSLGSHYCLPEAP